jgi:hypothetical protein
MTDHLFTSTWGSGNQQEIATPGNQCSCLLHYNQYPSVEVLVIFFEDALPLIAHDYLKILSLVSRIEEFLEVLVSIFAPCHLNYTWIIKLRICVKVFKQLLHSRKPCPSRAITLASATPSFKSSLLTLLHSMPNAARNATAAPAAQR